MRVISLCILGRFARAFGGTMISDEIEQAVTTGADFERQITFRAAYDKRDPDPTKNYGIHSVEIRFLLKGPKGATQFLFYTGWFLPEVRKPGLSNDYPMPVDLGYYSLTPQYENDQPFDCDLFPSGKCYYDGSSLNAEPVFERLLREGHEGVWAELEDFYRSRFG